MGHLNRKIQVDDAVHKEIFQRKLDGDYEDANKVLRVILGLDTK